MLIQGKVDINEIDGNGLTPLHHAIQTRDGDSVNLLLNAGAATAIKEKYGRTALVLVVSMRFSTADNRIVVTQRPPYSRREDSNQE